MKEKPVLFSTPMVQALLDGRKTQTRRVVKPQPDDNGLWDHTRFPMALDDTLTGWNGTVDETGESKQWRCPYGQPGDLLWVRETWVADWEIGENSRGEGPSPFFFKATDPDPFIHGPAKWKPSIHMPKVAARIWLRITEVRVERLQDISKDDIYSEGAITEEWETWREDAKNIGVPAGSSIENEFNVWENLWQSINGPDSWNANPFVWVVKFEVVSTTGKAGIK